MYRDTNLSLNDLEDHEKVALGGLIRVLIRIDGSFSEEEESTMEAVADEIGGREALWSIISRSAQETPTDDAIRAAAKTVVRGPIQRFMRYVLEDIARAETITLEEAGLLRWVDELYGFDPGPGLDDELPESGDEG